MTKIMIVEDDEMLIDVYVTVLKKNGFSIVACNNGKEALKALETESFDLILSDIKMPIMNGFDMLTEIRKKNSQNPPVILVSGYSEFSEEEVLARGAAGLLQKPIRAKELLERVHAILVTQND